MRSWLVICALLAGCDVYGPPSAPVSSSGMLMSRGSTGMQVDSAVMAADGTRFYAEIDAFTWCSFNTDDATMLSDTTAETSVVARDLRDGAPLVQTSRGLATIDDAGVTTPYWITENGIAAARYIDGGAVMLTDAGDVRFFDGAEEGRVVHPGECVSMDVDHDAGAAWAACGRNVVRLTDTDTVAVAANDATVVAWNDDAAAAIFADVDGLTAISDTGDELWTRSLTEPVLELAAVAGTPYFAALVQAEESQALVLISGDDGSEIDRLAVSAAHVRSAAGAARLVVFGGWTNQVFEVVE